MLTDHEKEKIRLEESYRLEVRQTLSEKAAKPSLLKSILSFFNTGLGLWLLSGIFITWGVIAYQDYKNSNDDKRKTSESVGRLDYEIKYRFTQVLIDLYESSKKVDTNAVKEITYSMNMPGKMSYYLYPDYKGWNLLSLLAEEKRLLDHLKADDEDLKQVISDVSGLQVFFEVHHLKFNDPKGIALAIEKDFYLNKWKNDDWYFSDGGGDDPWP